MTPTVDNVYVPFTCGIPVVSEDVGFFDFPFSLLRFFDQHRLHA